MSAIAVYSPRERAVTIIRGDQFVLVSEAEAAQLAAAIVDALAMPALGAALSTPPTEGAGPTIPAGEGEGPQFFARVAEVVHEAELDGNGFWKTCSGCHESEDGYDVGHYPFSLSFKAKLGGGCHECGGIGATWDTTDYDQMARDMLADDTPASEGAGPTIPAGEIEGLPLSEILADADRLAEAVDMGRRTDSASIVDTLRRLAKHARRATPASEGTGAVSQVEEGELALREATALAQALFNQHYRFDECYASGRVVWGVLPDMRGVLSQIGNMTAGLVRASPARPADPEQADRP